ncbi:hypothetical protein LCGC14_1822120 [marine sediment metagenome]|uniref:Uncharacterized protein n=1 Tax=marine sediment metagenome TaxID=412755 RepID=A0A0F9GIN8_9ZZZZ
MLLNVKQRLLLLNILPDEGNYDTLRIVRDQQNLLSFNEEEIKRLKIRREGEMYQWDEATDEPVEIVIGEVAFNMIKRSLRQLDTQGQLKVEFLPLYEHFVEGEDWPLTLDVAQATSEDGAKPTPIREPEPRTTKDVLGSSPGAEGSKD